eukprot:gene2674-biopygen4244
MCRDVPRDQQCRAAAASARCWHSSNYKQHKLDGRRSRAQLPQHAGPLFDLFEQIASAAEHTATQAESSAAAFTVDQQSDLSPTAASSQDLEVDTAGRDSPEPWHTPAASFTPAVPVQQFDSFSVRQPAAYSSSSSTTASYLPAMAKPAETATYRGERGAVHYKWQHTLTSVVNSFIMQRKAEAPAEFYMLKQIAIAHVAADSDIYRSILRVADDIIILIEEACLGYFPAPDIPHAVLSFAQSRVSASAAEVERRLRHEVSTALLQVYTAAATVGRGGSRAPYLQAQRRTAPPLGISAAAAGSTTPTSASAVSSGVATVTPAAPPAPVFSAAAPTAAQLQAPLMVRGEPVSPAMGVFRYLLAVLRVVFGDAGPEGEAAFHRLGQENSQGARSMAEWTDHVQAHWLPIEHQPGVFQQMLISTVIAGLNAGYVRAQAELWKNQLTHEPTLRELEDRLNLLVVKQQNEAYIERSRQVAAALSTGGKPADKPADKPAGGVKAAGKHTMHRLLTDAAVRDIVIGSKGLRVAPEAIYKACRLAMTDPHAPGAICSLKAHDLGKNITPHTNEDCRLQKQKGSGSSEGAAGGAAGNSQLITQQQLQLLLAENSNLKNQQQQMALAVQQQQQAFMAQQQQQQQALAAQQWQMSAMAAGMQNMGLNAGLAAQGLPNQIPKAAVQDSNRGYQQQSGASHSACEHCGRPGGHPANQFCYINDPARAKTVTPAWGPDGDTTPAALHVYLQRCQQQKVTPRLKRVQQAFATLMQQNVMSAQLKQWLRQQFTSGPQAAAGQWQQPLLPAAATVDQPISAMAAQHFGSQLGLTGTPAAYTVTTPSGAAEGGNPLSFGQLDLSYSSNTPAGSGYEYFQAQAAQLADPTLFASAMATTRSSRGTAKLQNPAQLHGFMPVGMVPADPNTAAGGRPQPPAADPPASSSQATLSEGAVQALSAVVARAILTYLQQGKASPSAAEPAASSSSDQDPQLAAAAGTVQKTVRFDLSSSSSSSSSAQPQPVLDATASLKPQRILFEVQEPWDANQHLGKMRVLHRIAAPKPGQQPYITIQLSSGKKLTVSNAAHDDGAAPTLITEAACRELGISISPLADLPDIFAIDGEGRPSLIGKTEPLTIILAEGSERPLVAFFPKGSGSLLWHPDAPINDFSTVNGVPLTMFQGEHAEGMQQHQLIRAAFSQLPDPQFTANMGSLLPSGSQSAGQLDMCMGIPPVQQVAAAAASTSAAQASTSSSAADAVAHQALPASAAAAASSAAAHAVAHQALPESAAAAASAAAHNVAPQALPAAAAVSSSITEDEEAGSLSAAHNHWYQPGPAILDQLLPDPVEDQPHDSRWTVHEEGQWIMGNHPQATQEERDELVRVLQRNKGAFAYSLDELPAYVGPLGPASFQLKEDKAMWSAPRRYTAEELAIGDAKVEEMLSAGIIQEVPTTDRHASAITLPMKRAADGSWTDKRFCIDLRQVNANTLVDRYGMPLPEELFQRIQGSCFLTKLDMRSGFFAIALEEDSQKHTAFCRSMKEHLQQLEQLLQHFQKVNLRAHPGKTIAGADCLPYLGHLLDASAGAIRPDPAKVSAMAALQPPDNLKRLQAHIGLFSYYRCYIPFFSVIARPLYQLTKQGTAFVWGPEQQQAYDQLKAALMQPGVALRQPAADRPFTLYTDWSTRGIAAVLNQQDEQGREYMVACTSRSLNQAEQNYAAWKGEMLAVIHGLKAFRPYLLSRDFKLITDHRALLWLLTHKQPVGQQARWLLCISEFRFDLQHRPGTDNPADVPSREPVACAADWTGSRLDSAAEGSWLPQVFNADGSKDTTVYSHDQLAAQLCIQPVVKSSSSKAARQPAADTTALAGNMQQLSLAAESSAAAQRRMQQAAYFVAGVDPCTSAYSNVSSEHERGTDQQSAISNQQLASADSLRPSAILASAATAEPKQEQSAAVAWEQQQLSKSATAWVRQACEAPAPQSAPASSVLSAVYGQPDSSGIRITQRLNTSPVHASFFPAAFSQGIVLYEPCGGLCAGLEMCLRNGISVRRYLYSDIDAVAQRVALHRVRELQTRYPHLLQPEALASSFSALPADIRQVTTAHLQQQLQQSPQQQWLVVAGWPCQDFSSAGRGKGMAGSRAQLLFDMVRIIGALQQLCPAAPPAYLLENVAFQHNRSSSIQQDYQH